MRPDGAVYLGAGGRRVFLHVAIAEAALGKPLPKGAVVHHANRNPSDNRRENLVICPNQAYHLLIHQRMRAMEACGHADWRKCKYCKRYDAPENVRVYGDFATHPKCNSEHVARYK